MDFEITDINVTAATIRFRNKSNEDGRLKKGPFFNGTQAWSFEKNDIELFKNAVWQGYLDASRTFHGIEGTDKTQVLFLIWQNRSKPISKMINLSIIKNGATSS